MATLEAKGEILVGSPQTIQQLQGKNLLGLPWELLKKLNSGGKKWQGKSHQ
jgi:hypothetical protein